MLGLKKRVLSVLSLSAVLMITACSSVVFPDYDDNEDDVLLAGGGRIVKELPEDDGSLKADDENASYEGDEDKAVAEDENESDEAIDEETIAEEIASEQDETVNEEEKVEPAKVEEVTKEDLKESAKEDVADDDDKKEQVEKATQDDLLKLEELADNEPSVSYKIDTFYFEDGSSYLNPKYNQNVRRIAKIVKENKGQVWIYGHASSRTRNTDPINHKLVNFSASQTRAQNVAEAFRKAGVAKDKILLQAMSDTEPAYLEVMPEGERLNRRVEVYVAY